jgi:hypothetical protein
VLAGSFRLRPSSFATHPAQIGPGRWFFALRKIRWRSHFHPLRRNPAKITSHRGIVHVLFTLTGQSVFVTLHFKSKTHIYD